jgi:DNA-binding FadR family transcriptional regulator
MGQKPSYLKSLKKESVVQSVINCLTDAIRAEDLKPGDRIPPEPELAETLGVARSSVREAVKILTYLGVLESKRSEGTFVCSGYKESMIDPMVYGIILNKDSFENLMELREMTEAGMMRLAIEHHDESELEDLEAKYPIYATPDSPTKHVGGRVNEKFSKVTHEVPMKSLGDIFSKEEVLEFLQRVRQSVDTE